MLKAGIQNFGQPTETETVEINHDGTAHFGDTYFQDTRTDWQGAGETAYLSVGRGIVTDDITVADSANATNNTLTLTGDPTIEADATFTRSFTVDHDGTKVTISASIGAAAHPASASRLLSSVTTIFSLRGQNLWEQTIDSYFWQDGRNVHKLTGGRSFTRTITLQKGTYYLDAGVTGYGTGSVSDITVKRVWSNGITQVFISENVLRFFAGSAGYFDLDARRPAQGQPLLRIKGNVKIDGNVEITGTLTVNGRQI